MRAGVANWLAQMAAVTGVGLRTVPQRLGASLATVFGVAGVVAVFVAVLSIAEGFRATLARAGSPDNALVLRAGSDSEMMSVLFRDATRLIAEAPGVARGPAGPLASAELFVVVDVPKRSTGTVANVPLRGVQPAAFAVRGDVRLVAGRMFEWGKHEIVVGRAAAAQFAGLELGARPRWGQGSGRSSASSRPAAGSGSRSSGATSRCCSPPTAAARRCKRCWRGSRPRRRSTPSATLSAPTPGSTCACCARASTTSSSRERWWRSSAASASWSPR
ncbi:MAG: ABC transporter permease [Thermoanaerobaculia bacterium]|nr:ABC transporter permease [Thermoanaerobaculia bacterium]